MRPSASNKRYIFKSSKVLLVIAHPDDEAMFFGPLLLSCKKNECNINVLCLSNGNADGKGSVRKHELIESVQKFAITEDNVIIIDHESLQDGFNNAWDVTVIQDIVLKYGAMHDIIVTFDNYGVSGHPNHIATHEGVKRGLININRLNSNIVGLQLDSVNVIRIFLGIFDLLLSSFTAENLILNVHICSVFVIWSAMYSHRSQFVWYRIFFILFSRYTYMNSFKVIN